MDIGAILSSPIIVSLGAFAGFVFGLVARPYFEARFGVFKETATSRREFQRATLTELQTTLASLDHRLVFEPLEWDATDSIQEGQRQTVAEHRLRVLTDQVRDVRVVGAMDAYLGFDGHDFFESDDPRDYDNAYNAVLDRAHAAIANALRDL